MALFGPKPWFNPSGKISIFRLFELLMFIAYNSVFSFQNIVNNIFLGYIAYRKQVAKMAICGPKPWFNPSGKMSIFRLFELLFFIAQKDVFSSQNIVKDIFLAYIAYKEQVRKVVIFKPKPRVSPFGKMTIFRLFNLFFLQPRKAFFRSRIS